MLHRKLERFVKERRTLLGVGPMSVNCVDATIELANEHEIPLMLIASRRQIDSEDFNGGYVNNWTTREFANYVLERDKKGKVLLARDHGGPWQNPLEVNNNLGLRQAMDSAKLSYSADIDAGFEIIHIDPSVDIHGHPKLEEILDRVYELYEYCWNYAQNKGRKIIFEVGTEEQSGGTNTIESLDFTISSIKRFCKTNNISNPSFIVMQTGTRVMETRNMGSYDSATRIVGEIPPEIQIPKMVELCNKHDIMMKVHNTDYLSSEALKWYPRLGKHAANVAPEFGVAETLSLLSVLESNGFGELAEKFLLLSYNSMKWAKWMLPNSNASDRDKGIIAGHYVFSSQEGKDLLENARLSLKQKRIDMDELLKAEVKASIYRYLKLFRMVG
jgi:tagatose-1,6-bisphosphate aldolase non-catalytic subunit AgaZ/GatZ